MDGREGGFGVVILRHVGGVFVAKRSEEVAERILVGVHRTDVRAISDEGQGERLQRGTAPECAFPEGGHAAAQCDALEVGAAVERAVQHFAARHADGAEGIRDVIDCAARGGVILPRRGASRLLGGAEDVAE